jgi:hypothetical protein
MNLKFFTHKYFRGGINFLKNGRSCTSFTEGLKMVEYAGVAQTDLIMRMSVLLFRVLNADYRKFPQPNILD